jgi:hypothetical protein
MLHNLADAHAQLHPEYMAVWLLEDDQGYLTTTNFTLPPSSIHCHVTWLGNQELETETAKRSKPATSSENNKYDPEDQNRKVNRQKKLRGERS